MAIRSLAFGKSVSQSSTAYGADAFRAVDSNTNGNWNDNSVTSPPTLNTSRGGRSIWEACSRLERSYCGTAPTAAAIG